MARMDLGGVTEVLLIDHNDKARELKQAYMNPDLGEHQHQFPGFFVGTGRGATRADTEYKLLSGAAVLHRY